MLIKLEHLGRLVGLLLPLGLLDALRLLGEPLLLEPVRTCRDMSPTLGSRVSGPLGRRGVLVRAGRCRICTVTVTVTCAFLYDFARRLSGFFPFAEASSCFFFCSAAFAFAFACPFFIDATACTTHREHSS